jgi:chorismate lyase/3-hydroxybenzoate synthase
VLSGILDTRNAGAANMEHSPASMTLRAVTENRCASAVTVQALEPRPPRWVQDLLGEDDLRLSAPLPFSGAPTASDNNGFTLLAASVDQVTSLSSGAFIEAVRCAYQALAADLSTRGRHPLRFWNFIPDIHAQLGPVGDRYMAFNVGRFEGFSAWFGAPDVFSHKVATSSAVGIEGKAFWVYVLASDTRAVSVENPRQIPSYRYSQRFGLRPPCFARASKIASALLIGGTASIVGEDSLHAQHIEAQTSETLRNIAEVIAMGIPGSSLSPLDALRDVRVHVTDPAHAATVIELLTKRAPNVRCVEVVRAEMCRRELLVEIEGVAAVGTDGVSIRELLRLSWDL